MTIEQNAQVSNWGADGAEALPKAPPLPIDGVELKHCPCYYCTNAQFNFKRLPIFPPYGYPPLSWGNLSLWWEYFYLCWKTECLLIAKTLTFVQTTAMGWQQLTGCSSPSSSSPQCSFLLWVSSTILQTFFQALSEDPTSNQNECPPSSLFQVRTYTLGALRYDHKILWSAGGWSSHCGICFVDNCDKNSAPQGCCSSARWRRPLPRTTTMRSRTSSLLAWVGSVRSFAQSFHDN